jgi:hypothetical protein
VRTGDNGCEDLVCEDVARTCEGTYELVSILLMSCTASDVKSFGQISQAPIEISRIAYLWTECRMESNCCPRYVIHPPYIRGTS